MTLENCLEGTPFDFEILGTDIDSCCIGTARKAVYTTERIKDIPAKTREKYFLRGKDETDGFVKVKKSLRDRVRFEVHNLNSNRSLPHTGKFDVIFCRNALIYFSFETCSKVLAKLQENLEVSSALVLGLSEPIETQKKLVTLRPCFYITEEMNRLLSKEEEEAS